MSQSLDDKFKLNGSVQFVVYDQNNNIINRYQKHNTVYANGIKAYKQLIGTMDDPNQPYSHSTDDDYQLNLQSNPNDFLSRTGKTPFLQPITIKGKKNISLQAAFRYKNGKHDGYSISDQKGSNTNSIAIANDYEFIKNQNAFVKNSDNSLTTIITKGDYVQYSEYNTQTNKTETKNAYFTNGEKWCYIYDVPQEYWCQYKEQQIQQNNEYTMSSDSSDSSSSYNTVIIPQLKKQFDGLYHNGLRVDIKGPQSQTFRMQIAYDFDGKLSYQIVNGNKNYNFDFEDLPQPIFPPLNGKPTNRQFAGHVGGAITNDTIHSYFYDLYPRYCKMPKKIVFFFEHCTRTRSGQLATFDTTDIQIDNIQFFRHTLPKCGPLAIYFQSTQQQFYKTNIHQVTIKDSSICYYASLGYKDANGMQFNRIGLSNSKQNYKFVEEKQINYSFNTYSQQKIGNVRPQTNGTYFYRLKKAQSNQCDNILTVADVEDWSFKKTSKNRLDIIYKMNVNFGDQQ